MRVAPQGAARSSFSSRNREILDDSSVEELISLSYVSHTHRFMRRQAVWLVSGRPSDVSCGLKFDSIFNTFPFNRLIDPL